MLALITGASSGIGREFAKLLSCKGYDLILVARREERLKELSEALDTKCYLEPLDLSIEENCRLLFDKYPKIDILINNAGFGVYGEFSKTELEKELNMIDVNIKALHILTKLYLSEFVKDNKGYILNVASSASFFPGPLMATYYSSKSYVLRLSTGIYEELKKEKSGVSITVLCPGPVDTEFNDVANVNFAVGSLSAEYVAKIGLNAMFKKKRIAIPGFVIKLSRVASKIIPEVLASKITYRLQKAKEK